MKKKLLALAAAGLMSISAVSVAGINPYNIGSADYPDFELLGTDPAGAATFFTWNASNDEFLIVWDTAALAAGDPSAFIGNDDTPDFLKAYDSLTATLNNSSGEETNFALFINYVDDGGNAVFQQSSFVELADNQGTTLNLDFSGNAALWNSVGSFGLVTQAITSDNVTHVDVPEPSSIATLGAGLLALSFVARRRKSAQK